MRHATANGVLQTACLGAAGSGHRSAEQLSGSGSASMATLFGSPQILN
jgi:hypothetical protein